MNLLEAKIKRRAAAIGPVVAGQILDDIARARTFNPGMGELVCKNVSRALIGAGRNQSNLWFCTTSGRWFGMERQGEKMPQPHDQIVMDVLKRVADGIWYRRDMCGVVQHQCAFCNYSPDNGHASDCEVLKARQALEYLETQEA